MTSRACGWATHSTSTARRATPVTRTLVVTGGWQTSKEPAYVEASRARQGTDWFVSREDLGIEGQDTDRINRLAEQMRRSHAQTPSLVHPELPDMEYGTGLSADARTEPPAADPRACTRHPPHPPSTRPYPGPHTMSRKIQESDVF